LTDEADDQGGAIAPRRRSVDRLLEDAQAIEAESAKEADALGFMARGVGPRPPCCIAPRQRTKSREQTIGHGTASGNAAA